MLAPLAFGMFTKAPAGARMMTSFSPFMNGPRLDGFQADMATIGDAVNQGKGAMTELRATPAGRRRAAAVQPSFAAFARQWRGVNADMGGMIVTIKRNLPNYQAVVALPSFRLFPWFFVIPGALLLGLGLVGLFGAGAWARARWAAVVIGLALVLAPVGFQMFARAPKGAAMMSTFRTIETRHHLRRIQGYFGEIADGQGLVQLQLLPALRRDGVTTAAIERRYPALPRLDADWIHILNDMTPMIAAMSNNIGNYQAISSLPSFRLFPWFFVLPGVLAIALALIAGSGRGRVAGVRRSPEVLNPVKQGVT
jgi:hypothetical protein